MVFDDKMHDIINILENDGVILYPTDTVWGLGCSVQSTKAINRIKLLKNDKDEAPLVILSSSIEMTKKYVDQVHPRIETLHGYHKKPLTVIYPKPKNLPDGVISEEKTVAIRTTSDPFCQTIIDLLGHPIVSTIPIKSKNLIPFNFNNIDQKIVAGVDYVCLHQRNIIKNNLPSVIIKYDEKGDFQFIRS